MWLGWDVVDEDWSYFGGPGRDRTDDLFHAMEARSQLRHRPTLEERRSDKNVLCILSQQNTLVKPPSDSAEEFTPAHT